ncbi:hypothetical protein L596_022589 [Steinernema carpocapsae]|uniref:Peptidase A2 domain-containing protein n=1 Tax=Steinernema carpocapsae TaxID=34508 RepID=A0A4U5MM91_STECR|nr:hypothetical protein L596_022589 [Steinernema carpocapsae]
MVRLDPKENNRANWNLIQSKYPADVNTLIEGLEKVIQRGLEIQEGRVVNASVTHGQGIAKYGNRDGRHGFATGNFKPSSRPTFGNSSQLKTCQLCDTPGHEPAHCFVYATTDDRNRQAEKKRLCFVCLSRTHRSRDCRATSQCSCCGGRHHVAICRGRLRVEPQVRLLPPQLPPHQPGPQPPVSAPRGIGNQFQSSNRAASAPLLAIDVTKPRAPSQFPEPSPSVANPPGEGIILAGEGGVYNASSRSYESALMILDTGSGRSVINATAASRMKLPIVWKADFTYSVFGSSQSRTVKNSPVVELIILTKEGKQLKVWLHAVPIVLDKPIKRAKLSKEDIEDIKDRRLVLSESQRRYKPTRMPEILLGVDLTLRLTEGYESFQLKSGLYGVPSMLGCMISGCMPYQQDPPEANTSSPCLAVTDGHDPMTEQQTINEITEEWSPDPDITEAESCKSLTKRTNAKLIADFERTTEKRDDGYYVRFPYKGPPGDVPSNMAIAKRRLGNLWDQLNKTPDILEVYHGNFMEQLRRGMIEVANLQSQPPERIHYLPHQAVVRPDKATTKVRTVLDAAAHFRGCPSLNDSMHQGPSLIPLIMGINLRMRLGLILLLSDVEKAFLMIKVFESERDALRFFWLKDPKKPPSTENTITYRYTCVPFGITASPFLLSATIANHLKKTTNDPEFAARSLTTPTSTTSS